MTGERWHYSCRKAAGPVAGHGGDGRLLSRHIQRHSRLVVTLIGWLYSSAACSFASEPCGPLLERFLSAPRSKEQARVQAEELVAELEVICSRRQFSTGFSSRENLRAAIMSRDPISAGLATQLESETHDIAIHAPSMFRQKILEHGLLSSRQVDHHRGNSDPSELERVENRLTFKDACYAMVDSYVKPKYGLLRPSPRDQRLRPLSTGYGDDAWILRKSRVRRRVSWTPGDSMIFSGSPESWDNMMVPWTDRLLLVPFLRNQIDRGRLYPSHPPDGYSYRRPNDVVESLTLSHKIRLNTFVELQVWGPIDPQDIEAIEFSKIPPTAECAELARVRGIAIWDGRTWPPEEWKGRQ